MIKIVFTSDWHLGLKTEEIDRTDEIISIVRNIIRHCVQLQEEGHDVYLILGGDLFDSNVPSEKHIAEFIRLLGLIKQANIPTFVMVGNHEAIADPDRLSCLSFVKAAKLGYPNIKLIEDIQTMQIDNDGIDVWFTFLPHVSNALIANKVAKGNLKKEVPTQKYIDAKCKRILTSKVKSGSQHYVFSHLNVRGAHGGSEENLLRRSEVYIPEIFIEPPLGHSKPTIVQGHIHSAQDIGNIHIIGSPIFCSFGERDEDKLYAVYTQGGAMGEESTRELLKTSYRPFLELEIDMMGRTDTFLEQPEVLEFLENIEKYNLDGHHPIVKFDVSINPENNTFDWKAIKKEVEEEFDCTVKNIVPRILIKRSVKSIDQKIGLSPEQSVKVFLNKNITKDKKKKAYVWKYAQQYLEAR